MYPRPTGTTEGYVLGSNLVSPNPTKTIFAQTRSKALTRAPFPDGCVVAAFDSKKKNHPRVGIIYSSGDTELITEGDSPVLRAKDLESMSLIDQRSNIYASADSLGKVYVFQLIRGPRGNWGAYRVNDFQLQVPFPEGIRHTDKQRTNIEAMRIHPDPFTGEMCISWAGRGGADYAAGRGRQSIWLRTCPFDLTSYVPLYQRLREGLVFNTSGSAEWRAISDVDFMGTTAYFATAVDREEQTPLRSGDTRDALMQSGKLLFDSQIVATDLLTGQSEIVARIPFVKVEAIMVSPLAPGCIWWGSDDEALGTLVGEVSSEDVMDPTRRAVTRYKHPPSGWGLSGMAPGPVGHSGPSHRIVPERLTPTPDMYTGGAFTPAKRYAVPEGPVGGPMGPAIRRSRSANAQLSGYPQQPLVGQQPTRPRRRSRTPTRNYYQQPQVENSYNWAPQQTMPLVVEDVRSVTPVRSYTPTPIMNTSAPQQVVYSNNLYTSSGYYM
eukprot:TRINITY_DN67817_c4_g5_i1.p1 TRINITY_DN67817_c4_g5~~TRINITY_DN67817_c4_g5_i1.p1  ORF type:complete len:501 (+),score=33.74 TRINITY_DN67817_c4_g5_i1:24-1505(+)